METYTIIFDTKEASLFLPKTANAKRVYLSSTEEVEQALKLDKRVYREEVKNEKEALSYARFYVEVPVLNLLQNAL